MNLSHQINFIEDPLHRTSADKPVMCLTTGMHYYSVFIEVSLETYITKRFKEWLDYSVFPRLSTEPGASVRIAIIKSQEIN